MNEEVLQDVTEIFTSRGLPCWVNRQLWFGVGKVLSNMLGTAPGMLFKGKKMFISLPGVPYEMKGLMEIQVLRTHQKEVSTLSFSCFYITQGIGNRSLQRKFLLGKIL